MPLIVLCGRNSVGKDTVADIIEEYCKENSLIPNRFALADPIKDMACDILGINRENLEIQKRFNISIPGCGVTMRMFLINLSRNILKSTGSEMFWMSQAILKLKNEEKYMDIITDMRYQREYDTFRDFESPDSITIKITRKNISHIADEDQIDSFITDYTIENDGSIADLKNSVKMILDEHFSMLAKRK